ncbi:MAG: glycerol-3-phosphate 1-O-acyltransferase PlsY [Pseudomonadales bacterium]|nr:glycerol-3-phosphate 1-O-acyltransferase PlsY [Pseudomonadales bacterium]
MHILENLLLLIVSYLLGSVCTAIPVCKLLGLPDPRSSGSGNPGTTNVLRVGGKGAALLTLAGDMLKGVIPVLVGRALGATPLFEAALGFTAFLGHLFPLYYRFAGGKGVATAFGVLFALNPILGLCTGALWIALFALTRYSSLAALVSFGLLPALAYQLDRAHFPIICLICLFLITRHHANIRALLHGQERRFSHKTNPESSEV